MKIILEFDALMDFQLAWLRVWQKSCDWQSAEDIIRPLINKEYERCQELRKRKGEVG